ncbi:MAG: hypothetical protein ISS94_00815 [Candidatus Syntrophoarchaeum sp.]|nr:hypothetical protein [Candidatus Syntrophoarchaeum sp.]
MDENGKRNKLIGKIILADFLEYRLEKFINFVIYYTNESFSIEYIVDNEKLRRIINDVKLTEEERKNISRILHKLRRINTRNQITHEILKGIVEYQSDYFESDNDLNLKLLSRLELARTMAISNCEENSHSRSSFVIDASRISRATQGLSIITPQGKEVSLKSLFPTKRDIAKRRIKVNWGYCHILKE